MEMMQITDFIVGLMIQVGTYYKIKRNKKGWLISLLCICYWASRAISCGLYSQSFWHIFSFSTAMWGYYSWTKQDKTGIKNEKI